MFSNNEMNSYTAWLLVFTNKKRLSAFPANNLLQFVVDYLFYFFKFGISYIFSILRTLFMFMCTLLLTAVCISI